MSQNVNIQNRAVNGSQMQLSDAFRLTNYKGEMIEWERQDDGSYRAEVEEKGTKVKDAEGKDKELAGTIWTYSITPRVSLVDISVSSRRADQPAPGPLTGEDAKKADKELEELNEKSEKVVRQTTAASAGTTTNVTEDKSKSKKEASRF